MVLKYREKHKLDEFNGDVNFAIAFNKGVVRLRFEPCKSKKTTRKELIEVFKLAIKHFAL